MRKADYKSSVLLAVVPQHMLRRKTADVYGQYLRHRRVCHQITQREVATLTGVKRETISKLEVGVGEGRYKLARLTLDTFYDYLDRGQTKSRARIAAQKVRV